MSVFIPISKKDNAKESSNYRTIALISDASKVILKILQTSLPQYVNHELPDIHVRFIKKKKKRGNRSNCQHLLDHSKTKRVPEKKKKSTSALLTLQKPLTVWITTNCGKKQTDGNTRPPGLPSEKSVCRSRSNS